MNTVSNSDTNKGRKSINVNLSPTNWRNKNRDRQRRKGNDSVSGSRPEPQTIRQRRTEANCFQFPSKLVLKFPLHISPNLEDIPFNLYYSGNENLVTRIVHLKENKRRGTRGCRVLSLVLVLTRKSLGDIGSRVCVVCVGNEELNNRTER